MFPLWIALLGGSLVFLDMGHSILFLVFPLFWVFWFIYDWKGFFIIMWGDMFIDHNFHEDMKSSIIKDIWGTHYFHG